MTCSYPHHAPSQGHARNKDKLVSLLEEGRLGYEDYDELGPAPVEEVAEPLSTTGRISIWCTASGYDLKGLRRQLEGAGYQCKQYPEVLWSRYIRRDGLALGSIMLFEYGVVVFWDLSPKQERSILEHTLKQFEEGPLPQAKVETDTFQFRLQPYNDVITLGSNIRDGELVRISISFALSQSTKLSVHEERVMRIAGLTRGLPSALAHEGKVKIHREDIAKLIGRVFIEQSQLNLLGTVLDTPDFFWDQSDAMQSIYDKVWEYLEMNDRIDVINTRLAVLHEMLDMLRSQQHALHSATLEWIVIWLILIDVVILLFQLAATMGWVGKGGLGPGA
eukprot:scaffold1.g5589.t1